VVVALASSLPALLIGVFFIVLGVAIYYLSTRGMVHINTDIIGLVASSAGVAVAVSSFLTFWQSRRQTQLRSLEVEIGGTKFEMQTKTGLSGGHVVRTGSTVPLRREPVLREILNLDKYRFERLDDVSGPEQLDGVIKYATLGTSPPSSEPEVVEPPDAIVSYVVSGTKPPSSEPEVLVDPPSLAYSILRGIPRAELECLVELRHLRRMMQHLDRAVHEGSREKNPPDDRSRPNGGRPGAASGMDVEEG
jgi:hypothetical protein